MAGSCLALRKQICRFADASLSYSLPSFFFAQQIARAGESIDLTPQYQENGLTHVSIQLDVGGHDLVRATSDDKDAPTQKKLPSSVAAKLSYDELRLSDVTSATTGTPLAIRYYDTAEAVIKVDNTGRTPKLADDRRLIVLAQADQRPALYCPDAPLDRKQLDLIDVVGDSYAVDRLLPSKASRRRRNLERRRLGHGPTAHVRYRRRVRSAKRSR